MKSQAAAPSPRRYRMVARAATAEATAEGIMDAARDLFWEQPTAQIRLEAVAQRAGVTVQTLIRRFGTKDDLFAATVRREHDAVRAQRDRVEPGDVPSAISTLLDHYEDYGDRVLRLLTEEDAVPAIRLITDDGRQVHRDWCSLVFEPFLTPLDPSTRRRRNAQFVAVCDVYTWKLLRRDLGLSRAQTQTALEELLAPLTRKES